ncbi:MAG: MaoC family dehydratase [Propionibacteriales bacterium]|nr:MaoC family dehydratase [Propionibacteriales bacterium]
MTRVFGNAEELAAAVGQHLGYGDWFSIDQARIDAFAEATGDNQWMHVDPVRAAAGPFGTTIAHGYLTLSLLPVLTRGVVEYAGWSVKVNYGCDRVRFPTPVRVGSRVRAGAEIATVRPVPNGLRVTMRVAVEVEHPDGVVQAEPALVAATLTLLVN